MSLHLVSVVNSTSLIHPGFSLMNFDGDVFLFGQKGWPKRACPTGVFNVRYKQGELKLRPVSFCNDSCYLPPLRCPAVTQLAPEKPESCETEQYFIHGGKTPNNELSDRLYIMSLESRGCNKKVTLQCVEKELVGDIPEARYGHTINMVYSHGKKACVLFGGRSYMPLGQRTTENWNSMTDCSPHVYLIDLDFGCCTSYTLQELTDGQSFHVSLSRKDSVYFLGGHSLASNSRPPRLFRLRVELLLGSPALSCEILPYGLSLTSAIVTRLGPDYEFVIVGGYTSDSRKRFECNTVVLDDSGIHIMTRETPEWTGEIRQSKTWFGGSMGEGSVLMGVPAEGGQALSESNNFYIVKLRQEEELGQTCSQESTDQEQEDSVPLEDSEEFYFNREPDELQDDDVDDDTYNEEDEEDESQTGYWVKCCLRCQVDINTWVPNYSTELNKPAMIFCSKGEEGHWVHALCMDLSEDLLVCLSQENTKYFCMDHMEVVQGLQTPPPVKLLPVKHPPMKNQHRKVPVKLKMSPAKKSFIRRLFE
ncbi:V(D)J recombination activating protein 2 [Acipenser ruthenus]|uniref:V(D)J recombination-activating protein 2 n=1 Tax=Acipenser ruthenus TaxID=7906 RepID=A0A444V7M4_ACIRT|nr:V(D)J recombination activating protein 2 [Acipenser ruthenus]